jgi:uncharacterized protein YjiS (DUF1127 family)
MSFQDKTLGPRGIRSCAKRGTLPSLIPGKLFMKKIYLMTTVTMVDAVAVLSRMRAVESFGSIGRNLREQLHSGAGKLFRRLRRMINARVAAAIAHRERRVTQFALRNLSDIELKDFGAYRGNPASVLHRRGDVKFATRR